MTKEVKPKKKALRKTLTEAQKAILTLGPINRTPEQSRAALRKKVKMFYDLQRMRMQAAGRGQPKAAGADIILHEYDIVTLDARAGELLTAEKLALKDVEDHLQTIPFYISVLSDKELFKGVGPTMAGVILSEFDINRADTPSKFWAYAGLAPVPAFRCKGCNRTVDLQDDGLHFKHSKGKVWKSKKDEDGDFTSEAVDCSKGEDALLDSSDLYTSGRSARPQKNTKLPYNAFLRSKLLGVLGPVLLKTGSYYCIHCNKITKKSGKDEDGQTFVHRDEESDCSYKTLQKGDVELRDRSPWIKYYDNNKQTLIAQKKCVNDSHRHKSAIRYMVKMLIAEIWGLWRDYEKLARRPTYAEEKLGHVHSGGGTPQQPMPDTEVDPNQAEIDEELKLLKSA